MQLIVGQVSGAHGLKGHVKLIVRTDDPELRFQPGVVLDTDRPDLPALTIAQVRGASGSWQVLFEEIADRTAAEGLRGTTLTIETEEWDDDEESWYDADLKGLPAATPAGEALGTVVDVEHGPAQDLLVVRTPSGATVRVPFVTALVPDVSAEGVVIDPPGGLFDGDAE